jgi:hypothetical protein
VGLQDLHFLDERYAASTLAAVCLNEGLGYRPSCNFLQTIRRGSYPTDSITFKFYAPMLFGATETLFNELLSAQK